MQHRYDGQKERTSMTMSTQCSQVMQDINQLGWEKLSYVDPSFRRLELTSRGDNGRDHCITVHMDPQVNLLLLLLGEVCSSTICKSL